MAEGEPAESWPAVTSKLCNARLQSTYILGQKHMENRGAGKCMDGSGRRAGGHRLTSQHRSRIYFSVQCPHRFCSSLAPSPSYLPHLNAAEPRNLPTYAEPWGPSNRVFLCPAGYLMIS